MIHDGNPYLEIVEIHIKKCLDKSQFHAERANSCKNYQQSLNVGSIVVSAGSIFTISMTTAFVANPIVIGCIGAGTLLLNTIIDKIKQNFSFDVLQVKHENIADDFKNLEYDFTRLKIGDFTFQNYEITLAKYLGLISKAHILYIECCI